MRSIICYNLALFCIIAGVNCVFAQDALIPLDEKYFSKDVEDLAIDVRDADVTINTSYESTLHVQIIVDGKDLDQALEDFERQNYSVKLDQSTLRITSGRDRSYTSSSDWQNSTDIDVILTMPSNLPTILRTSDGDLDIEDLTSGAVIQTSDGNIWELYSARQKKPVF